MGLYSAKYAYFAAPHDLVSPGVENVWITEVGSATLNGTFDSFKKILSDSLVRETIGFFGNVHKIGNKWFIFNVDIRGLQPSL